MKSLSPKSACMVFVMLLSSYFIWQNIKGLFPKNYEYIVERQRAEFSRIAQLFLISGAKEILVCSGGSLDSLADNGSVDSAIEAKGIETPQYYSGLLEAGLKIKGRIDFARPVVPISEVIDAARNKDCLNILILKNVDVSESKEELLAFFNEGGRIFLYSFSLLEGDDLNFDKVIYEQTKKEQFFSIGRSHGVNTSRIKGASPENYIKYAYRYFTHENLGELNGYLELRRESKVNEDEEIESEKILFQE